MAERRPSEWKRLFAIACELVDQLEAKTGGSAISWSFGGGTALMIQIAHRESHDIDLFLDDAQLLGFIDPTKSDLNLSHEPEAYDGDGTRFQKFAFQGIGEIDFIVAGALTGQSFIQHQIEGRSVRVDTVAEIIAKKVFFRGLEAKPRDIFDIAAASLSHRSEIVTALGSFPDRVALTLDRMKHLNPEFVAATIDHLMILPGFQNLAVDSLPMVIDLFEQSLSEQVRHR